MTYTVSLQIELDALTVQEALEASRDISEDITHWPVVISVAGEVPKETT